MGLITEDVEVGLVGKNITFYEGKGYNLPKYIDSKGRLTVKRGTKILVKVEDLMDNCTSRVEVVCDGCSELLTNIKWVDYLKCVKEDGKYYCHDCSMKLYGRENYKKTRLENGKSFYQWCYDNLSKEEADKIMERWDYKLNKVRPEDVSYGSAGLNKKGYWFKCLDHPEHKSEQKSISSFTGYQCKNIICNQCNCIKTTHPYLIKYLVNIEDSLTYSMGSDKNIPMKCPDCGHKKNLRIPTLIRNGFSCPKCGDGKSYPEKFMFNVLEQLLNKNFITQLSKTTFKWCENYRYDFYVDIINCIIETHGEQHYKENTNTSNRKNSLKEIQENDKNKELLAKENGIENYIIIDCRYSELEWIKNSIIQSELPKLLNFKESDINWLKCHEYACNSLVKIVCDMWNDDVKKVSYIADKLKIGKTSVIRYLKQGVKLGWCDYDPKESLKQKEYMSKKVICLTNKKYLKVLFLPQRNLILDHAQYLLVAI